MVFVFAHAREKRKELKSKEKRKGSAKKGLEEKRGKKGEILANPAHAREKRNERNEEAQERHPKTCRNINSPKQFIHTV